MSYALAFAKVHALQVGIDTFNAICDMSTYSFTDIDTWRVSIVPSQSTCSHSSPTTWFPSFSPSGNLNLWHSTCAHIRHHSDENIREGGIEVSTRHPFPPSPLHLNHRSLERSESPSKVERAWLVPRSQLEISSRFPFRLYAVYAILLSL
jgi:hypothetical protein